VKIKSMGLDRAHRKSLLVDFSRASPHLFEQPATRVFQQPARIQASLSHLYA
jgi:hypothetical protein